VGLGRIVCAVALAKCTYKSEHTHTRGKITIELPKGLEVDALREAKDSGLMKMNWIFRELLCVRIIADVP
jgi:hypothetical protein